MPDKHSIARNFSLAAATYDAAAEAQRHMAMKLAKLLPSGEEIAPAAETLTEPILELGCGTGILTEKLIERYRGVPTRALDLAPGMIEYCRSRWQGGQAPVFEVADAEDYLSAECRESRALIASNCTFQWFTQPDQTLANAVAALAPGGWLAIGAMLDGSLAELSECYLEALGRPMPGLALWDRDGCDAALARAGLRPHPISRVEEIRIMHPDPMDVLRSLKAIGANIGDRRPVGPGSLRRLARIYRERYDWEGGVVATWRAYYLLARRPD